MFNFLFFFLLEKKDHTKILVQKVLLGRLALHLMNLVVQLKRNVIVNFHLNIIGIDLELIRLVRIVMKLLIENDFVKKLSVKNNLI